MLEVLQQNFGVVSTVVEIDRLNVPQAISEIRRQRKFGKVRSPEGRRDEEKAGEGRPVHGLRQVFEKDRSAEGMTHQNRSLGVRDQLVDTTGPSPVLGIIRARHPWGAYSKAGSQPTCEQRF